MSEKRKALLAQKEKILEEIKYYDKRIEEACVITKKSSFYEDDDSDNETDLFLLDNDPSLPELKQQEKMLQTCVQATQELTSLEVLQSEVNVLVEDPPLNSASPVKGEGVWREVVAECCLDLVPFAITFYAFKANRSFAPIQYRGLKVTVIKKAHEVELSKSVLPGLTRPSDAVEVIRGYSVAHRSRRTTLARLANKFSHSLSLEPIPEGGYRMKCANLLEVSWTLQNKWSPVAPFHHRMKFDLEYMDEAYIKTITQAHRQLSEPDVDSDERTLLLAKIISTCLEAQGPTQELHESMSSDPETAATLHQRRTTLDREPEAPSAKRAKKDGGVMAPPASLPKRAKKGNHNVDANKKTIKRPIEKEHNENDDNSKKAKIVEITQGKDVNDGNKSKINNENNVANSKNKKNKETCASSKNNAGIGKNVESSKKKGTNNVEVNDENNIAASKRNELSDANAISKHNPKKANNVESTKRKEADIAELNIHDQDNVGTSKNNEPSKKTIAVRKSESIKKKSVKKVASEETTSKKGDEQQVTSIQNTENTTSANKIQKAASNTKTPVTKVAQANEKTVKPKENREKNNEKLPKSSENTETVDKKVEATKDAEAKAKKTNAIDKITKKFIKDKAATKVVKKVVPKKSENIPKNYNIATNNIKSNINNVGATNIENNVVSDKNANSKNVVAGDTIGNNTKKTVSTKKIVKPAIDKEEKSSGSNANTKRVEKVKITKSLPGKTIIASANKNANVASAKKNPTTPIQTKVSKAINNVNADKTKNLAKKLSIVSSKPKATIPSKKIISSNIKILKIANPGKENTQNNLKVSKIPLKKLSSENSLKLPLRVSPRHPLKTKVLSKFGSDTKLKPQ